MTCHLSLTDNPPLQALHSIALTVKALPSGIALAFKTLHKDGESSNKVLLGYRHC